MKTNNKIKRTVAVCILSFSCLVLFAQTTVKLTTAGTLSTLISNPSSVTQLTITGPMNDADYEWLRDNCINLTKLDLSGVTTTTMPKNALTRAAYSDVSMTMTVGGQSPRYELTDGSRVVFIPTTSSVAASSAVLTSIGSGAKISPDPTTVTFADGTPVTFTVTAEDGVTTKTYKYYVTLDDWFTAVVIGDPEEEMTRSTSEGGDGVQNTYDNVYKYFTNMVTMATTQKFEYDKYPFIKPLTSIVFSLGDCDTDRSDHTNIKKIFNQVTAAGIPLITLFGNHDWDPEEWGDGSYGFTSTGNTINKATVSMVKSYVTTSSGLTNGISDVTYFTTSSGDVQPSPFTFKYKGVQFFMGESYWFQCPYTGHYLLGAQTSDPTFYAPDEIITSLQNYITNNSIGNVPSVWMQHYPIGCEDRWWMNQDASGNAPFSASLTTSYSTATSKRDEYKSLIRQTKNPVHFSGHVHTQSVASYTGATPYIYDYVCSYGGKGGAYIVLLRSSEGFKEAKNVSFNY